MTSEADQTVRLLAGFMQLSEAGQLPSRSEVGRRAQVALGFLLVQYTTTKASGDADHAIELMTMDELTPLLRDVQFVLRGHGVRRSAVYAVLVEEQPDDFVSAGKHGLAEAQRAS